FAAAGDTVIDQRLADDVADSEARVERGVGVLEHHLELAPVGPHLAARQRIDALAVDADLARGRVEQFEDRLARGRLAAPALADEAQSLARGDVEGDAVDRVDLPDGALQQALFDREMLDEPANRKQRRGAPTLALPRLGGGEWGGARHRLDHAKATRSEWKQAAKCPASFSSKAGISRPHISVAKAQRASNGQPGVASLSDGTVPGISASRGTCSTSRV